MLPLQGYVLALGGLGSRLMRDGLTQTYVGILRRYTEAINGNTVHHVAGIESSGPGFWTTRRLVHQRLQQTDCQVDQLLGKLTSPRR